MCHNFELKPENNMQNITTVENEQERLMRVQAEIVVAEKRLLDVQAAIVDAVETFKRIQFNLAIEHKYLVKRESMKKQLDELPLDFLGAENMKVEVLPDGRVMCSTGSETRILG